MRVKFWIKAARDIALPQSMLPALTALVLCIGADGFCWWLGVMAVLGVAIAHLGMNLADDYFDYKCDSRNRSTLSSTSIRARMDKCSYINSGEATIQQTGKVVCVYLLLAGLLGLGIVIAQWIRHDFGQAMAVAAYAMGGLILGVEYGGRPLKLSFYGLGELVIGAMFGVLNMLGVMAACTHVQFSMPMLVMSIGIGAMVTNIIYVHSCMEVEADGELDKMTFARLLVKLSSHKDAKTQTAGRALMVAFLILFTLTPFICLTVGIILEWWSAWYLLTLCTLPMSVNLIISTTRFIYGKPTDDTPKWWMGPMGKWEDYQKAGIDWFLIRWLQARNIVTFFCLILIICHIVILCV